MALPDGSMFSKSDVVRRIIISGPSGSGKTTLINRVLQYNEKCQLVVSHTTRSPRDDEIDTVHYHFVDQEQMKYLIQTGEMFEFVEFDGQMYGTSKSSVYDVENAGKICIFDVLAESALKLKKVFGGPSVLIFIKPPSLEVLKQRLLDRGDTGNIERRIESAKEELEYGVAICPYV
ncbi:hypothetical protein J437_LFUL007416 [Ladona fulva]|uniref:Guanylate kinase-like domain-containing protein n=1 Tax=Ladona fulva TaxID=123851 RepID=A0A8K0K2F6_LADFU|nr:hypothetical protein J437_LFUL007416 [Ladona fulva]